MVRNLGIGIAALALGGQANAATVVSGADALKTYNLITFGDFTAASHVDGKSFVGGNLTANNTPVFNMNSGTQAAANGTPGLTVAGNVSSAITINNGGGAMIGGNTSGQINMNGANQTVRIGGTGYSSQQNINQNTYQTGQNTAGSNFTQNILDQSASIKSSLTNLSTNLAALSSTASASTANNKFTYSATSSFNVINTTIDQLKSIGDQISITSGSGQTTIINVAGNMSSGSINANMANTGSAQNIIWNFYEATSLTLGDWQGTVLAPKANFVKDGRGALNGTLVANTVTANAEIHSYSFQGDLSSVGGSVSAMPEPATWAMLILGFGLVGGVMRRQRGQGRILAHA